MALTDYTIDTSGSPQDVQRRQKLADALMQQGSDSSPAAGGRNGGWITALNRGLAGALGGYQAGQAREEDRTGRAQANAQLVALLGGGNAAQPQSAPMGSVASPSVPAPAAPAPQRAAPVRVASAVPDDGPDEAPKPVAPVASPGADSGLPTFGPNGKMMGNLTGNIGQPPAAAPNDAVASRFPTQSSVTPAAAAYLTNPYGNQTVQSALLTKALTPRDHFSDKKDADGNWYQVNDLTGQKTMIKGAEATPSSVREYEYYAAHPTPNQPVMDYATWASKKARDAATNISNVGNIKQEDARSKKIGEAQGEVVAEDIKAGSHASSKLRQLATLNDANNAGGDDISSGPLGKAILSGKQGFSELSGMDLKGVPESEVIQKVGFGLATNMVKAITNRPSQMEFGKALENVPGLYMSKQGRIAMTSILTQEAQAEREIGRLANNKANHENWQEVKDKYYENHPLMSPFTGKPFGEADVQMLTKSAPASGAAPSGATSIDGYTIKER